MMEHLKWIKEVLIKVSDFLVLSVKIIRIALLIVYNKQCFSPSNIWSLEAITFCFITLLSRWSYELSELVLFIEPLLPSTSGVECGTSRDRLFIFWSRELDINEFDIACFWILTSLDEFAIDTLLICDLLLSFLPILDENETPDECDLMVGDGGGRVLFYFYVSTGRKQLRIQTEIWEQFYIFR